RPRLRRPRCNELGRVGPTVRETSRTHRGRKAAPDRRLRGKSDHWRSAARVEVAGGSTPAAQARRARQPVQLGCASSPCRRVRIALGRRFLAGLFAVDRYRCTRRVYTHHSISSSGSAAQATIHHHSSIRLLPASPWRTSATTPRFGLSVTGRTLLSLASSRFTANCSYCGIGGSVVDAPTWFS